MCYVSLTSLFSKERTSVTLTVEISRGNLPRLWWRWCQKICCHSPYEFYSCYCIKKDLRKPFHLFHASLPARSRDLITYNIFLWPLHVFLCKFCCLSNSNPNLYSSISLFGSKMYYFVSLFCFFFFFPLLFSLMRWKSP